MQQHYAELSPTICTTHRLHATLDQNHLLTYLHLSPHNEILETRLTHQCTAVTDPPQSWVSHEIHVTSAQLLEQSEHTIAKRGTDPNSRGRYQSNLRETELLKRAANQPTPVLAPSVSILSAPVAVTPNIVPSDLKPATSPGAPKA